MSKKKAKRKASKKKAKRAPATKKAASKRKAAKVSMVGKLINLKVTPKQKATIAAKAKRYAGDNFSRWLRYAGEHFKPSKADVSALAS